MTGAQLLDVDAASVPVTGIAPAAQGGAGKLVFVEGKRNASLLDGLAAAAILCTSELSGQVPAGIARLVTPRPQYAFALVGRVLYPTSVASRPLTGANGISPAAHVAKSAKIEDGAIIEPGAVVGEEAS
ncbi:LpxD N-terminal domain-containing protein, partial [Rhizobiaceae sp. 2RAB30]